MPALPSPPRTSAPDRLPADCAERYRVRALLASGGFGAVFRAEQVALSREVAVKVLLPSALADDEQRARFEHEAKVTAAISHPHVVKVLDCGAGGEAPWIVYELLPGRTLRRKLDRGALPPAEAAAIGRQIAEALEAAHEAGIVHRDIKPENVLEAEPGVYKVGDFGVARWGTHRAVTTASGIVLGTPHYIAPETVLGGEPRPASDMYALGVVLFELLSGTLPFHDANPVLVLERHVKSPPPPLPGAPDALAELVRRLLAKRPEDRPTARQVIEALARVKPPRSASAPVPARVPPSTRRAWHAAGVALAAAALAAVFAVTRPGERVTPPPPPPAPPVASSAPAPEPTREPPLDPAHALAVSAVVSRVRDYDDRCDSVLKIEGSLLEVAGSTRAVRIAALLPQLDARQRDEIVKATGALRAELAGLIEKLPPRPVAPRARAFLRTLHVFVSYAAGVDRSGVFDSLQAAAARRRFPADWLGPAVSGVLAQFRYDEVAAEQEFRRALETLEQGAVREPHVWLVWIHLAHARAGALFRGGSVNKGRELVEAVRVRVPPEIARDHDAAQLLGELPSMQQRLTPRGRN